MHTYVLEVSSRHKFPEPGITTLAVLWYHLICMQLDWRQDVLPLTHWISMECKLNLCLIYLGLFWLTSKHFQRHINQYCNNLILKVYLLLSLFSKCLLNFSRRWVHTFASLMFQSWSLIGLNLRHLNNLNDGKQIKLMGYMLSKLRRRKRTRKRGRWGRYGYGRHGRLIWTTHTRTARTSFEGAPAELRIDRWL